jgi:hypothetical protein
MAENEETQDQPVDPDAPGFISGVNEANAKRALQAADDVGVHQWQVRVVRDGFEAPNKVVDRYQELLEADTKGEKAAAKLAEKDAKALEKAEKESAKAAKQAAKDAGAGTPVEGAGTVEAPVTEPVPVTGEAPASDDVPADNDDWTHARLDQYASDNGLTVTKTLSKPDKVAAILAALNEKE